ncbi:MAG: DNA polymerase III subunit delta' [Thermoflexaceae bacterium]|nr:DNA polymerase III subunit delta' [Thermoflexaceae bacterium]
MPGFESIVGHEKIKEHLMNAIKLNKISHAYILNGEEGIGKKTIASVFAKAVQCEEGGVEPCGKCHSCIQAESGNQPDIIWVSHEKPASIGVEDVRLQVNSDILIKPYSSRYKVYIIDEAQKMTVQAQNALLKTIEEPPSYGIIMLLTTNADSLLPTILSRCVTLNLKPLSNKEIEDYLMTKEKIPDYRARFAASFAQGRLGRAIDIATSENFNELKDNVLHLLKYIDEMELTEIIEAIKQAFVHKMNIEDYIDFMMMWYRDVLIYKSTNDANLVIFKDELKYIRKDATDRSYEGLNRILRAMDVAKTRLAANVNFDLTMELMLLTIKEKDNG